MIERIKITFLNDEEKIIEVKDKNILEAYLKNNIDEKNVKGIDKVGD